jgi:hypothetical protein
VLRIVAEAKWYVPSTVLHKDLRIPTIREEIKNSSKKYKLVFFSCLEFRTMDKVQEPRDPENLVRFVLDVSSRGSAHERNRLPRGQGSDVSKILYTPRASQVLSTLLREAITLLCMNLFCIRSIDGFACEIYL